MVVASRTTVVLGVLLLAIGVEATKAQSLLSIEPGTPLAQAEEQLMEMASEVNSKESSYSWYTNGEVGEKLVTITAVKDSFRTRADARVQEISVSLSAVDVGSERVAELYDKYKNQWSETFGEVEPQERRGIYYWTWETDSARAKITFTESEMDTGSVDLNLSLR